MTSEVRDAYRIDAGLGFCRFASLDFVMMGSGVRVT